MRAFASCYAVTLTSDLWPCSVGPTDCAMVKLLSESSNPRRRYCNLIIIDLYDREHHVLRYSFTKFKLSQAIRSRKVMIILRLIRYITLWLWPLIRRPWKFVVGLVLRGHSPQKFDRNRTISGWVNKQIFAPLRHAVTLTFDPVTMRLNCHECRLLTLIG